MVGAMIGICVEGIRDGRTARRLTVMNLGLRGIEVDFRSKHADTFLHDLHHDLLADYVLANLPVNDSDCFLKDDGWIKANANFGVRFRHQEAHPRSTVQNMPLIHEHD